MWLRQGEVFYADKGFVFITTDTGGADVFLHVSALRYGDILRDGQTVSYDQVRKAGRSKYSAAIRMRRRRQSG
ncbi:cold shock domain-containing protein [Ensifer sp. ENS01]|uniref:cold shock domain-containing protein n=1 Tax=Ensifer sp. ENS01 TaxID=2769293 RepID=UPI001787123B|nr:cold-shock protein [Ensifer sp. ENS01]